MEKHIKPLYKLGIGISIIGFFSFPVLLLTGGNLLLSPIMVISGTVPILIGIGIGLFKLLQD